MAEHAGKGTLSLLLGRTPEERRISLVAALALAFTALVSSLVVVGVLLEHDARDLKDALMRRLEDRSNLVLHEIRGARDGAASIALGRPHLRKVLARISRGDASAQDEAALKDILDNIMRMHEPAGLVLRDVGGRVVGERGRFTQHPSMEIPLFRPLDARLLRGQAYSMRIAQPIVEQGKPAGQVVIEVPLRLLGRALEDYKGLGETDDTVICAAHGPDRMQCLPSRQVRHARILPRLREGVSAPMSLALEGRRGVVVTRDHRGQKVINAFMPIGDSGLAMVVKVDVSELYAPLYSLLFWIVPVLLILIAGGVGLLRWRIAPVVKNMVESRAQLGAILENAGEGIITIDAHGRVEWFNPAASAMFGYMPQEIAGQDINRLLPVSPEELRARTTPPNPGSNAPGAGRPVSAQGMGQRKNGDAFPVEIVVSAMGGSGNGRLVAIVRDITERKRVEQELKQRYEDVQALNIQLQETQHQLLQSEKMATIGQLAAGVAHEINNPIGYVFSNLGMLETYLHGLVEVIAAYEATEAFLPAETARAAVKRAREKADLEFIKNDIEPLMRESREGIDRVKKIVQDLKDFSRIDTSKEWQWADLHAGLDSTLNIVRNELKYKAEIIKEYGDLPEVECCLSQLNQVFLNLLVNAGHAIEGRGTITLRTGAAADRVWVEIEDTGRGIAPDDLQRIFDPFFTTKAVGVGTGLGLSLSFSIVKKHNGHIEVSSEPGKGARFRVWLPVKQQSTLRIESQTHA